MGTTAILPRFGVLSCLSSRDEETGMYISHCLNFDIMECGKTAEEAWQNVKLAVKQYVEHCYTYRQEGLFESAPREKWYEFVEAAKQSPSRMEELEFELLPPMQDDTPVWLQGVVTDGSHSNHIQ